MEILARKHVSSWCNESAWSQFRRKTLSQGCTAFIPWDFLSLPERLHLRQCAALVKAGEREPKLVTFEEWILANPLPLEPNLVPQTPESKKESFSKPPPSDQNSNPPGLERAIAARVEKQSSFSALHIKQVGIPYARTESKSRALSSAVDWTKARDGATIVRSAFLSSLKNPNEGSARYPGWRSFSWEETRKALRHLLSQGKSLWWCSESRSFIEVDPVSRAPVFAFVPPQVQGWEMRQGGLLTPEDFLVSLQADQHFLPGRSSDAPDQDSRKRTSGRPLSCRSEKHLVILLTSAAAALCIWEDGRLAQHKVITAYTVRAKQGKSQLNYMRGRTGGGLSVGGSLRMQETTRLFMKLNQKLTEWSEDIAGCRALFYSGPIRAWNEVFSCREPPSPIDRKDPRWLRVGVSTQRPRLKELQRICYILSHGAMGPIEGELK